MSCYSFARWGLCFWLVKAIREFRAANPAVRFVTMFHELWANGPLTTSAGWTMPFQRQIIKSVLNLSDAARTSRAKYRRHLQGLTTTVPVSCGPIFSNFGEAEALPHFADRKSQILLFQPPPFDATSPSEYWAAWGHLREQLSGIPTVVAGRAKALPADASIQRLGFVSNELGAQLLAESKFGLLEYFPGYLAKSSIFASFAAYGVTCFMPTANLCEDDGIHRGTHYLLPSDLANDSEPIQSGSIGANLFRWYEGHSIRQTAKDIHALLSSLVRQAA